ncbi:MAG: chloride channel protein [Duncaniella sp.]|nr:chloride channel protein [Duncaniella sp.]
MDNTAQNQVVTWARNHVPERVYILLVLFAVGVVTGVGAFVLKWLVITVNHLLTRHLLPALPDFTLILIPVAGLLITVAYMRYVIRQDITHGSDLVRRRLVEGQFDLRPSLIVSPLIASSITLGFGGSAGGEGPIATTGAAIGSNFARWAGLSQQQLRVIICCGAGAGIAAIFKAPVGGVFYTIEVLALPLTTANFVALTITCIISGLTAYVLSGCTPDLAFAGGIEPSQYGFVALMGLFCGLYSAYYSTIMKVMGRWYTSIKSRWTRAIVAGLITGGLLLIFPAMYGEGYEVMRAIINGEPSRVLNGSLQFSMTATPLILLLVTAGVMLVKAVGTSSATYGGVAGDFSPALFAGCMAGYVLTAGLNLFCGLSLPVGAFVLTGMAASMSGIIKAPLMAIFITTEMTGNFSMFLPIVIASAISYGVVAAISALRNIK